MVEIRGDDIAGFAMIRGFQLLLPWPVFPFFIRRREPLRVKRQNGHDFQFSPAFLGFFHPDAGLGRSHPPDARRKPGRFSGLPGCVLLCLTAGLPLFSLLVVLQALQLPRFLGVVMGHQLQIKERGVGGHARPPALRRLEGRIGRAERQHSRCEQGRQHQRNQQGRNKAAQTPDMGKTQTPHAGSPSEDGLGHFNFENSEMPWRPRERTPAPEAKAGPRSRRASAVAAGRLMDDDSNDRLWAASALELAQFQSESALALNRLQKIQHARIQAIGGPSARNCSSTPASAGRKPSSGASAGVTQRRFWPSAGQGSPLKAVTWKKCRRTRKPRSA